MPTTPAAPPDPLRYPIGHLQFDDTAIMPPAERERLIAEVAGLPALLRAAVTGLSAGQLETPYRPGGWTVRQLVHHVADSHMNAVIRLRLALTEHAPTIKPYDEAKWALLPDVAAVRIDASLTMLDAMHLRWAALLRAMAPDDYARTFVHPEMGRTMTLDRLLATYAWHGRHHTAHVTRLREREGW